jgi:hypothetical protein
VQLKVGAVGAEAARNEVAIDEAGVVIDDDVGTRCKDRRSPLEADEGALPISNDIVRRLDRARHRREAHGAATLKDHERATLIVSL